MDKKIRLVAKFLGREANLQELEALEQDLKEDSTEDLFGQMVKIEYLVALGMKNYNVEKAKKDVRKNIKKDAAKKRIAVYRKVAASVSILLVLSAFLIKMMETDQQPIQIEQVVTQQIQPGTDKAVLTLENGDQVVLEKGKNYKNDKVSGNGKQLVYSNNGPLQEPVYNYLTVPRGGQFYVQLPDGSEVWLNSESKLKYPLGFANTGTRKVELIYGEAFFKVSPSTQNNGMPFTVVSKNQEVNVLGTEFNLKAYQDEEVVATTLVEGGVEVVNDQNRKTRLVPGQQSRIKKASGDIDIRKVDIYHEISWRNNLFSFEDESLEKIMKTLSRWYDFEVVFESADHKDFLFTGILERTSSVEDILTHIEATGDGEIDFEITNKMILIKMK